MGRKLNLSHLSENECERILHVIQRDFDLREKEKGRLEVIETELKDCEETSEQVNVDRKRYNEKHCIRCCSAFNLLFNKKFECSDCKFFVCRNCATWQNFDSESASWICILCLKQRALKNQSCEWFYDHIKHKFKRFGGAKVVRSMHKRRTESDSENDSGYDPSTSVCSRESSDKRQNLPKGQSNPDDRLSNVIHQHIESLVEGIIGEAIDSLRTSRTYTHPEYICLFDTYKGQLSEAITQLYCSLDVTINNKPSETEHVNPTSAHVVLKNIISEIVDEAMKLPSLQDSGNASASSPSSSSISHEDYLENHENYQNGDNSSYEDMLASAILNKVIEQYQRKTKLTEEAGTDTDDLQHSTETVIDISRTKSGQMEHNTVDGNATKFDVGIQSDAPSELDNESVHQESSSFDEESATDEFTWNRSFSTQEPVSYIIEEEIEEILTETYDTESEEDAQKSELTISGSPPSINEPIIHKSQIVNEVTMPELDYLYSGLDFVQTHKVSFPEFGMDIIDPQDDGSDDQELNSSSTVVTAIDSWEENWLFKKKKKAAAYGKLGQRHLGNCEDPICMLIPNPSDPVLTKIGSIDIDQLSDLSEQNSVGSIEFSLSDESDDEDMESVAGYQIQKLSDEIVSEFSQKDSEYTIDYYKESDKLHQKIQPDHKLLKERATQEIQKSLLPHRRQVDKSPVKLTSAPKKQIEESIIHVNNQEVPIRKTSVEIPKFNTHNVNKSSKNLQFSAKPESIIVHSGKTARIFTTVKGISPFDVAWFKDGKMIEDGGRFQVYWCDNDKFYLDIFDTDKDDNGCYSCVAFNKDSEIWADFNVRIRSSSRAENVPEFVIDMDSQAVKEGSPIRVSCKITGYPEPQVVFIFKDQHLRNNEKYLIDNLGFGDWTLEIKSSTLEHNGRLVALARNKVGEAKCSAMLITEPDTGKLELCSLTERVNKAKENIEVETQGLLDTATQQAAVSAMRRTTGQALDVIAFANEAKDSLDQNLQFSDPPKPGTIAEREHTKWLKSDVSMPNNPYTPENLAKRRDSNTSLISPGRLNGSNDEHDVKVAGEGPRKIDCGLRQIESERYQRDYYINGPVPATRRNIAPPKPMPRKRTVPPNTPQMPPNGYVNTPEDHLNLVEEKVYISAGNVFSLEDRIKQLESQVQDVNFDTNLNNVTELEDKVALTVAQVEQSNKNITKVEEEIARIKREVLMESCNSKNNKNIDESTNNQINENLNGNGFDNNSNIITDESYPTLPSVKDLASKFKTTEVSESTMVPSKIKNEKKIPDKDVILVEKTDRNYNLPPRQEKGSRPKQVPDYKVHSLTARMVSKEFRNQVRINNSKPVIRTSCIVMQDELPRPNSPAGNSSHSLDSNESRITSPSPSLGDQNFQHGYTSDESTTSSNSHLNGDKQKRKSSKSVLTRTSYWEKRAEEGLLSDCSVTDDFPRYEIVPQ